MAGRREALCQLLTFVAGSPLYAAWMIAAQRKELCILRATVTR